MSKLKSKLGCVFSSLFICVRSKKKRKDEKKNVVADGVNNYNTGKRAIILDERPVSPPNIESFASGTSGKSSVYYDTNEGTDDEWNLKEGSDESSVDSFFTHEIDGQFFFTAKDDRRISKEVFEGIHLYPPFPTVEVDPALKSPISLTKTKTLLHSYQHREDVPQSQKSKDATELAALALEHQAQRLMYFDEKHDAHDIFKSTNLLLEELKIPDVKVSGKGFPGALSEKELEAVERFRSELKSRDPIYNEIVHSFSVVEKEAYSLCRWLRARKFDVDAVFQLLDEARHHYEEAKQHDFYPNLEDSLGFSRAVFLSQYPEVYSGNARNGCPVMYFKLGSTNPEGIKCLMTLEEADRYFWNTMIHCFPVRLEEGRRINPNFVRTENITIYDLEGFSRSQVTSDTLGMVKVGAKVMSAFPETLHCLVIINAPSWFGVVWSLVSRLIDARTASKIEVFTSRKRGYARMQELIDNSQIPSDYGGTGPSLVQAASASSTGPSTLPQSSSNVVVLNKTVHVKQEKRKQFEVKEGETMSLTIYSRCKNGVKAAIFREGSDSPLFEKDVVGKEEDKPYSVGLGDVKGPGNFEVRLKSIEEPGTFLILGTL